ncbi:flagellar biogenesis protein FliO [Flavobacterium sp. PL11]|nr:flagellar biogenesis protein FliO [Flavobacterium sp. PL11]
MRDNSNTFLYIVAGIILLHLIVGFSWLVYKLTKKEDKKNE